MSIEIKVPELPESVADATVGTWHKQPGDAVKQGENVVDLETDKIVLEVPAPEDDVLETIIKPEGEVVEADTILANLGDGQASQQQNPSADSAKDPTFASESEQASSAQQGSSDHSQQQDLSPAVRRLVAEYNLDPKQITGTGKKGKITKADVEAHINNQQQQEQPKSSQKTSDHQPVQTTQTNNAREEKRVPMPRLRARVAERLVSVQQETAMLTTFNEVDMQAVKDLRARYKETFEQKHEARLGFMSFFTKATVEALKRFPDVNASIDGNEIVYHGYFDIGMAVSTDRGLVVPVIRDADQLSFAEVEKQVADYGKRGRDGKLTMDELTGGTFTITNGGVFGSLLSTPIINPPQSGILGLHKIEDKPVVRDGQIVIRPMMYLAMSYDHRIIDGKQSVQFLKTIKELIEDPARLMLEI